MRVIIALADTTPGEPLTCGRTYGELPVANKPLLAHLVTNDAVIITTRDLSSFARCVPPEAAGDVLKAATTILPADIFFTGPLVEGLNTIEGGSLETREAEKLLQQYKGVISPPKMRVSRVPGVRVNLPWELLTANQHALDMITSAIDATATIEDGVTIQGEVVIGAGTIVKAGSYLEGPITIGKNCTIGPQAYLRPHTSIADNCTIGKTEVVDCVLMAHTVSKHHAYLGHSVLGEDVNVGAMTVTSDYRHDGKEHMTVVQGQKVATGRRKLGAFIGDGCRLGIHTSFYPGRKLWPGLTTLPGEIVRHDRWE